jgi:4-amino-4-deoxy-L-arabinose transferase-like glycosyltransferase
VAYALRPAGPVVAPLRLAVVRAAVVVGAVAALLVEGLSTVRGLTFGGVLASWLVLLGCAAGAAWLRYRRDGALPRLDPGLWRGTTTGERALLLGLAALLLAELVVALASPPNNWDSQTYHLPKIEHWVQRHDVDFFATGIDRQVGLAPGAEYLLLHLRLLTGGDLLYNLLQWSAGLGCVLAASRIAAQLGGNRIAQLVTAFIVGTAPMVVLESTSTQTDLAVAAWVGCVATLVLDRGTSSGSAALLGAGTGLAVLTKAPGVLGTAPLLLIWLAVQLRRAPLRALGNAALIGGLAVAITGPYLYRTAATYHSPLGPPHQQQLISMQRHDPPAVLVNVLRIGYTALEVPYPPLNAAVARGVTAVAHGLGVDPSDRDITFFDATFPVATWQPDEDKASFPVQGIVVLVGAGLVLLRRRTPGLVRAYAGAFWLTVLLHVATVKWQPWGNRLLLYLVVLGAPLAGLCLAPVLSRSRALWRPRLAVWAVAVILLVGGGAGWLTVGYGWPRRLVGHGSVFSESRFAQRFNRRPQWAADYVWAADALRAAGAHRVGLVQGGDTWEYPWWVLLPGTGIEPLQSNIPGYPAARAGRMDAVLCVADESTCGAYAPTGWRWQVHGIVRLGLPARGITSG